MARRFLLVVLAILLLVVAAAIAWRLFGDRLVRVALVPSIPFDAASAPPAPDYAQPAAWIARPGLAADPARFVPEGFTPAPAPAAATFFLAPTAFFGTGAWNSLLDDKGTNERLDRFVAAQASVFNGVSAVWAPRYRQATFGTFLKDQPDADRALDLAYGDVRRAFAAFVAAQPPDRPIILAGHSQGARHLLRLVAGEVRGTPLAGRVVAIYAIGWPVALEGDLARLGFPACTARDQAGCILSWQSFAADAPLAQVRRNFGQVKTLEGTALGTGAMLCVNPLSGTPGPAAVPAAANPGSLKDGALLPRLAGARCDASGLLLLEPVPRDIGPYVLPDGNFHVYDYNLFWAAVRADAEARLMAAAQAEGPPA